MPSRHDRLVIFQTHCLRPSLFNSRFHIRNIKTAYFRNDKPEATDWPPRFWKFALTTKDNPPIEAAFVDSRRFARVRLIDCVGSDIRNVSPLKENGPDPVVDKDIVTEQWLAEKCASKKIPIKALLLDQANISGIGNWVGYFSACGASEVTVANISLVMSYFIMLPFILNNIAIHYRRARSLDCILPFTRLSLLPLSYSPTAPGSLIHGFSNIGGVKVRKIHQTVYPMARKLCS